MTPKKTNRQIDWSQQECEHATHKYFAMLKEELRGNKVNKAEARRELQNLVDRSRGAIERKHQNISAVLDEIRHPWIRGYKPLSNYQLLLAAVVKEQLRNDKELRSLVIASRRELRKSANV